MRSFLIVAVALFIAGCQSEPNRIVNSSSGDGRFKLTLESTSDWARPGEIIPVKVRLERSADAQLPGPEYLELTLIATNGDVSPSSISVPPFVGSDSSDDDNLSGVIQGKVYETWVQFRADSRPVELQAELNALYKTVFPEDTGLLTSGHVKLRIRISEAKSI